MFSTFDQQVAITIKCVSILVYFSYSYYLLTQFAITIKCALSIEW